MSKYKDIIKMSKGGFGVVYSANDSENNTKVAIKVINLKYHRKHEYKRIFREIDILQHLQSGYSVWLIDVSNTIQNDHLLDIRIVMPLMDFDLRKVMEDYNLIYIQIIQIMYQLFLALKYLNEAGIIHRDLKPSNIGINQNMDLKLLDFGLAREINGDMTEYVVTRWYRPIEVFCDPNYTTAVDMWSAGCIFTELFTGNVLFKGTGQVDQVTKIIAITGFPDAELLKLSHNDNIVSGLKLYEHLAAKTNLLESHIRQDIENFIQGDDGDQQFADNVILLICRMLDLDPSKRPTPEEALVSPLFQCHTACLNRYVTDMVAQKYSFPLHLKEETDESLERMIIQKIKQFLPRV